MTAAMTILAQYGDHHDGWEMAWMWIPLTAFMIVTSAASIWATTANCRNTGTPRHREGSGIESATRILAERYARSEIDADEYRERLDHLR
jgi:putative membrane protein